MTSTTFTPRSQDEIATRVRDADDFLGFDAEALIGYLDFDHAKPFLKDGVTAGEWETLPNDEAAIRAEAIDYLSFAWGKAQDHRGISAGRSVTKLTEWMWLLGYDDLVDRIEFGAIGYAQYGAPVLAAVSEALGQPVPDDAETQRMVKGLPCRRDCMDGCGT